MNRISRGISRSVTPLERHNIFNRMGRVIAKTELVQTLNKLIYFIRPNKGMQFKKYISHAFEITDAIK